MHSLKQIFTVGKVTKVTNSFFSLCLILVESWLYHLASFRQHLCWHEMSLDLLISAWSQVRAYLTIPVLQPVLKVLEVLDLGENLLENEGIHVIREPLMVNCSVLQLSLAQSNITCEGTKMSTRHDFYVTYNVLVFNCFLIQDCSICI